ncbi:MAG: hypothetical protein IJX62_03965 [Clostridia bacterium]|nr:hypothetical protein [Clostridia bacterium]
MKALTVAICLLIPALLLTVANAVYINEVVDTLLEQLEELPEFGTPDCVAGAGEIKSFWEDRIDWIRLTVGYPMLDAVSEQAALLHSCALWEDVYGYHSARALLRDALEDLRRLEMP